MNAILLSLYLKENYTAFISGVEVDEMINTSNQNLQPGQHVMVFKDTIATTTLVTVPPDKESDNVGVEGVVLQVNRITDLKAGKIQQQVKIKKM